MRPRIRILAVPAVLAGSLLLRPHLGTAQKIVRSFDGDSGPSLAQCQAGPSHCGRQPEMNVAADGKQVVQTTWQNIRVYDYSGTMLQSTPLAEFIRKAGLAPLPPKGGKGPFEPHVVFDEFIGRWISASGSHRVMNVMQLGSHLYGVLGSGPCTGSSCGAQGKDTNNLMFYVDLDCSKPAVCLVSQTAKISGADFNAEFGTVGVDVQGNVGIVAVSSTASTYMGLLSWSHRKTDPANVFTGPKTIIAGTQPYTCMPNQNVMQIGSTVGIPTALHPVDGTKLWTTQQWSNNAAPCVFNTRIIEYQIDLQEKTK